MKISKVLKESKKLNKRIKRKAWVKKKDSTSLFPSHDLYLYDEKGMLYRLTTTDLIASDWMIDDILSGNQ